MLIREKLLRAALAAEKAGVREVGGNNHGPEVRKFLAEVGLPEGYAWCDAFVSYELHAAAGRRLPIESAGVAVTLREAAKLGWVLPPYVTPARGDLVLYDFDGDGQTDDHIGIVIDATKKPLATLLLHTVEGNTSSGVAGSQTDGDGVYLRTRLVRRANVAFIRIPGAIPDPPRPKRKPKPAPKLPTLKKGSKGSRVRYLQNLLAKRGAKVVVDGDFGQRTKASVVAFQRRNGLAPDGVVGPKTWRKLVA